MKRYKKIAILHDFFYTPGGGERVVLKLLSIFPGSDLFTLFINPRFEEFRYLLNRKSGKTEVSQLQNLLKFANFPGFHCLLTGYSLKFWQSLDLSGYSLIISSTFGYNSKYINSKGILHLSYIHAFPFWLYDPNFQEHYLPGFLRSRVKNIDLDSSRASDVLIANSKFTQRLIKHYYHRDSVLIYPPIEIPSFHILKKKSPRHYIFFSRLDKQKGPDLAIQAFNRLGKLLYVIGDGPMRNYLHRLARANIVFLGHLSGDELTEYFLRAKAVIYCSVNEAFGMAPVEAMAYGIPIIAYASGGVKETIVGGKTGIFFNEYSPNSLIDAVRKFERAQIAHIDCYRQAVNFSADLFSRRIRELINRL